VRFRYHLDPLFLGCLTLYVVSRWVLKPLSPAPLFHHYLNDLICIPFWVPLMLLALRRMGWRAHDRPPESHEILVPLVTWSLVFEVLLPRVPAFRQLAFSDPVDVLSYTLGALAAVWIWRWTYRSPKAARCYPASRRTQDRRTGDDASGAGWRWAGEEPASLTGNLAEQ